MRSTESDDSNSPDAEIWERAKSMLDTDSEYYDSYIGDGDGNGRLWLIKEDERIKYGLIPMQGSREEIEPIAEKYLENYRFSDRQDAPVVNGILEDVEEVERLEQAYKEIRNL